jgi:phytoene/squalene synthetase
MIIYIPQEDLIAFGVDEAEIFTHQRSPRFKALMRFQSARAHALYEESWPRHSGNSIPIVVSRLQQQPPFIVVSSIAFTNTIYDVFSKRAFVPFWRKIGLLWQARQRLKRDFQ